ncbi:MAG: response regulator receiver protein [Gammaproteobacteria bacterium]|nr:response regulator receiver protein [Gammaproteobacteria bacterium]
MRTCTARIVALVDDDADVRVAIAGLLESAGFEAVTYASAEQFLELAHRESIRCLVLDLGLPGIGGAVLLRQLRASGWCTPVICMTGQRDPSGNLAEQVLRAGARTILYKPFDSEELLQVVESADVLR